MDGNDVVYNLSYTYDRPLTQRVPRAGTIAGRAPEPGSGRSVKGRLGVGAPSPLGVGEGIHARQFIDPNDPNDTAYLHGDLIRSTMLLTDEGGTAVSAVSYTAFGEVLDPNGHPGGSLPTGFPRYAYAGGWGYETAGFGDASPGPGDTGYLLSLCGANPNLPPITLQHVGWRWYQPDAGRFVQRDPIGVLGGLNVYAYSGNTPTVAVDPDGEWVHILIGIVVGGVVGGISNGLSSGEWDWGDAAAGAAGGAVAGGLGAAGMPGAGGLVGGALTAGLSGKSGGQVVVGGAIGGLTGGLGALAQGAAMPLEEMCIGLIGNLMGNVGTHDFWWDW